MPLPLKFLPAVVLMVMGVVILPNAWAMVDETWVTQWAESDNASQPTMLATEVRRVPGDCPALLQMIKARQPKLAAKALRVMMSTLGAMGQAQAALVKQLVADNPDLLIAAAEVEPTEGESMPEDLGVTTDENSGADENPQQLNTPMEAPSLSPAVPVL